MALTKEDKKIVALAIQVENTMKTNGWKSFKKVWDAMYLDCAGGIDSKGNLIGPAKEINAEDYKWHLGYKKALTELYDRGIKDIINSKNAILEQLKESEDASNKPTNKMEREPDEVPHM